MDSWEAILNDKDCTDYLMHLSQVRARVLGLLSGFTFTAIFILLVQLPDPTARMSQITLLFLAVLFDLFVFLLAWQTTIVINLYKTRAPEAARKGIEIELFNWLLLVAFSLWGVSIILMFMLWEMVVIAVISGAFWVLVVVLNFILVLRLRRHLEELTRA